MTEVYFRLSEYSLSGTTGQDTSDKALVFVLTGTNYNADDDVMVLDMPFSDPYIVNFQSTVPSVNISGIIPCGTGKPFTTVRLAEAKLREIRGAYAQVKLEQGTWNAATTTWTVNGSPTQPTYGGSGETNSVRGRMTYSIVPDDVGYLKFTIELKIGSVLL